jgi:hypothetical protein
VRQILLVVEVILSFRVTHVRNSDSRGYILQFAIAVDLAGQTIQRMVGQHQLDDVLAKALYVFVAGKDPHVLPDRSVAGSYCSGLSVRLTSHIHRAYTTGSIRIQVRRIAERWHNALSDVSLDEIQNGFTLIYAVWSPIDVGKIRSGAIASRPVGTGA